RATRCTSHGFPSTMKGTEKTSALRRQYAKTNREAPIPRDAVCCPSCAPPERNRPAGAKTPLGEIATLRHHFCQVEESPGCNSGTERTDSKRRKSASPSEFLALNLDSQRRYKVHFP